MKNGFEKTAYEYSISESANNGGKLDWIEENVLNKSILENLNKITVGKHTNPIRIPQGFIILYIVSSESLLMGKGVEAILKRLGVTLLTLSSVHCADKRTATRSVKILEWSNGIGVSG